MEESMAFAPFERVALGRTGVTVSRLGLGAASIGGLYRAVADADAVKVIDRAWDMGIRYFDAAPLYGYGNGERRMGLGLAGRPRDGFAFSTKVGRLLVPRAKLDASHDVDRQAFEGREDAFYVDTPPVRVVFDYSYDGTMRSVEESLTRLGLDRVDILYIHDPDDHMEQALNGAYPALRRLREEGVVGAIGAGMNRWQELLRFAEQTDMDVLMLAGRYTLLDHSALDELLPVCAEKGIAVVQVGVMNSGILADPKPGATFNYVPAPPELIARAQALRAACDRYDVPLKAAAVQFALAHPQVVSLVAGVRTIEHLEEYPALMQRHIPGELWEALRTERLIPEAAPVPR
jgi:D-threo-aldose 1-dehydrogenase